MLGKPRIHTTICIYRETGEKLLYVKVFENVLSNICNMCEGEGVLFLSRKYKKQLILENLDGEMCYFSWLMWGIFEPLCILFSNII